MEFAASESAMRHFRVNQILSFLIANLRYLLMAIFGMETNTGCVDN